MDLYTTEFVNCQTIKSNNKFKTYKYSAGISTFTSQ